MTHWIEISPIANRAELNFEEARMYSFSLGDGWRLPTMRELIKNIKIAGFEPSSMWIDGYWYSAGYLVNFQSFYIKNKDCPMTDFELAVKRTVIPVRTIPDPSLLGSVMYRLKDNYLKVSD